MTIAFKKNGVEKHGASGLGSCSKRGVAQTNNVVQLSERIVDLLLHYRRASENPPAVFECGRSAFPFLFKQILQFVSEHQPILFVLPGFPCKSPNVKKVLGTLPDLAEKLSLRFLSQFCNLLQKLYAPGARIVICSDGYVFGDLIRVSDRVIHDYALSLRKMIEVEHLPCFDFFHLGHAYDNLNTNQKRQRLVTDWAMPLNDIRATLLSNESNLQLYRGITRFLIDDIGFDSDMSKTALQRLCQQRALSVIQRSWAWGDVVAYYYPNAIRLSIHPQPVDSTKFGILLSPASEKWITPWHGVCVLTESSYVMMKQEEAKRIGTLVCVDGIPSHYVASSPIATR